ncbi:carbohydrate ABC transporter permease [Deinococcus sp. JMULE3]|uniref:carbohydrate ABC transporter permease n=1 Tax=Deinococcus sp. JMULE3 TaxID=2518341 RepID=UPI0015762878|nr:sugar ABC transporter permease [Deinococcus sp. JMULE3]NTY02460.1 sugar ABC transporter permease [Deinococcus sp. JMULE3]
MTNHAPARVQNAAPPAPYRRAHPARRFLTQHAPALGLTLPFLILFALFGIWPVLRSLYLSFTDYDAISTPTLIGTANYRTLLADPRFVKALTNTATYMVGTSLLSTTLGLLLALVFGGQRLSDQIMRACFFLPSVAGGVGLISVFKWLFSSEDFGLINTLRQWLSLDPVRFLGSPMYAVPILIALGVWGLMGYNMILFVAGLRSIPGDIYEAAAIDGANPTQRFWRITLPLLRPTLLFVLVTSMIGAFQEFFSFYFLFSDTSNVGGILDSGLSLVVYLYDLGFRHLQMGMASALAWILFLMLFALTLLNLKLGRINDID